MPPPPLSIHSPNHPYTPALADSLSLPHEGQAWSYGFIRTCMVPALNFAVAVKPATYSAVLQLDATVRAYPIPQHMEQVAVYEEEGAGPENMSRAAVMLRFSSFSMKEIGQ